MLKKGNRTCIFVTCVNADRKMSTVYRLPLAACRLHVGHFIKALQK